MMSLSMAQGLSAGMASTIIQTSALISSIVGVVYFSERLTKAQIIGFAISSAGLSLIFYIEDGSVTTTGFLLAIVGALSLSLVNFLVKKAQIKEMFAFIIYSSLFAPVPLLIFALINDEHLSLMNIHSSINSAAISSALIQAYPTTLLGYWVWNKLLTRYPLSVMSPIRLLVPGFGILGSMLFFNESIDNYKAFAIVLVILGVALPLLIKSIQLIQHHLKRSQPEVVQKPLHKPFKGTYK
jgi:O-acetylserine/cysteine efflux transporter